MQYLKDKWIDELSFTLSKESLSNYHITEKFERKLAEYCKCNHAIATNSGTSALFIAMKVYGIKSIIGPAYGNTAWMSCARFLDIMYDTIDVRRDNFCMDEKLLKEYLLFHPTDAVLYINHGGYTGAQLLSVMNICKHHNVKLFEDSCNALGQWWGDKHAGTFGDVGFISFSTPKLISCGEGGAILTDNEKIYKECKKMVYHGGWYQGSEGLGLNFSMPMQNAFLLMKQLEDIDKLLYTRKTICDRYEQNGLKVKRFHQVPSIFEYETQNVEKIMKKVSTFKVDVIHKNYRNRHIEKPNAKHIRENTLMLPNYTGITDARIDFISSVIKMGEK